MGAFFEQKNAGRRDRLRVFPCFSQQVTHSDFILTLCGCCGKQTKNRFHGRCMRDKRQGVCSGIPPRGQAGGESILEAIYRISFLSVKREKMTDTFS
jgi:hypothetical protein